MNIFLPTHIETLISMIEHKVNFLLIGGYAVSFHGYQRTTGDMDLWIEPNNRNKIKILEVFSDLGYSQGDIELLAGYDFEEKQVFSIGEEPDKIDFITHVNLVKFGEAIENRVEVEMEEGFIIPVVSYKDLVTMKFNTGRLKDKADVEELQKINKYRTK